MYKRFNDDERLHILLTLVNVSSLSDISNFAKELKLLTKRDFIGQLPAEVVDHLLAYFDYKTALTACRVCKLVLSDMSTFDNILLIIIYEYTYTVLKVAFQSCRRLLL